MSDALVLREVSSRAWHDFQSRGVRSSAPHERTVIERWARALSLGASREGPPPEALLVRGAALQERAEHAEVVHAVGADALEGLARLAAARHFVVLLTDPEGVVVSVSGGGEFAAEAERVRLIEGADWSEAGRGTNAVGTAIAERRPVFVHGSAHFARRFHGLVCYAAPIFDADGALLGVLDATSRATHVDARIGDAVVRAARQIESALRERAYAATGASMTRTLARSLDRMGGAALLVEGSGRIARLNEAARGVLQVAAGAAADEALGVSLPALREEARSAASLGMVVRTASGARRARVEPLESPAGRLLAMLVFLDDAPRAVPLPPRTKASPAVASPFGAVFAEDAQVRRAVAWASQLAPSALPVVLLAETGGGKELFAHAIHAASPRAAGPFRAINCGSLSASLLESELFGYGPAAFTGAERRGRDGLFAAASGGTLFLDEVAEMPAPMQAALLRVLEDGTYQRVGETAVQRADVRVVCATCRDLDAMVASGAFRKDLYYRLHGARVCIPPLRARTDIVALARHVLATLAAAQRRVPVPTLSAELERSLAAHAWPGNVRELRTVLEVALVLSRDALEIGVEHLPPELAFALPAESAPASALTDAEGSAVRRVLAEVAGNVSLAAKRLGVARSTVYRMMRRHGLGV